MTLAEIYKEVYFNQLATLPQDQQARILAEVGQIREPSSEVIAFVRSVDKQVSQILEKQAAENLKKT